MTKDWFTSRVGRTVRFTYDYLGEVISKERTIKDEREAGYMWLMSERGYTFEDASTVQKVHTATVAENATTDDWLEAARPQVRIHRAPTQCLACEA